MGIGAELRPELAELHALGDALPEAIEALQERLFWPGGAGALRIFGHEQEKGLSKFEGEEHVQYQRK